MTRTRGLLRTAGRLLRVGEHGKDLADRIEKFTTVYNRTAKPFRWTYDGRPLKAA